ncbi:TadE/TadG family type IV pilus assembly protein [Rugamonas sp. CCM 8940]|uniref:TadE/TadG family type IV pilus assembly protein n=1 Tax=Rugamonas sp. CCM 8940 TaxID=2765359 RepID=UPI0018F363BD|nr:TadE/TadG family type IV pilus assembly protein [Rugamonas sp. CCM 8940]MBJ7309512.1 pilus assembly protein [Rugamonas sp. CCM 8940]
METSRRPPTPGGAPPARAEHGATLIEFCLAVLLFFLFLGGFLEFSRATFLWNTAQEITRRAARAAAMADFSNPAALAAIRQNAVFRGTPGQLPLGGGLGDSYVQINYLSLNAAFSPQEIAAATLPAGPGSNMLNCAANPNAANCIRFVRVRLCGPGSAEGSCDAIPYTPMLGMLAPLLAPLFLPPASTVVRAESLGYLPGTWP